MAEKTTVNFSEEEVRFIAVFRAIKELDQETLINTADAGIAYELLKAINPELEKYEKEATIQELKAYLKGYVSGLAATKIPSTYDQ